MLVPHRREDAELGECRYTANELEKARVFVGLEPVLGDQFGCNGEFVRAHGSRTAKITLRGNFGIRVVQAKVSLTAQTLLGERDPFRLHAPNVFRRALELGQDFAEDRLRLILPAGSVEQEAVARARFGARIIVRHA